jgi:hypothetical protein
MSTKDTFDKCIFCSGPVSHDGYEWVHVHSRDAQCGFAYSLNRPDTFASIKPTTLHGDGKGADLLAPAVAPGPHKGLATPDLLPPLIDATVLVELKKNLGDAAQDFAASYVRLWGRRYDRLALALDQRDQMAAMDAVLSIQSSSAMVGGLRLAWLTGQLKHELQSSPLANDRILLDRILNCGIETVEGLRPDRLELLWGPPVA